MIATALTALPQTPGSKYGLIDTTNSTSTTIITYKAISQTTDPLLTTFKGL
jgi:hypothetical protein